MTRIQHKVYDIYQTRVIKWLAQKNVAGTGKMADIQKYLRQNH
jgi:hypothetical protein